MEKRIRTFLVYIASLGSVIFLNGAEYYNLGSLAVFNPTPVLIKNGIIDQDGNLLLDVNALEHINQKTFKTLLEEKRREHKPLFIAAIINNYNELSLFDGDSLLFNLCQGIYSEFIHNAALDGFNKFIITLKFWKIDTDAPYAVTSGPDYCFYDPQVIFEYPIGELPFRPYIYGSPEPIPNEILAFILPSGNKELQAHYAINMWNDAMQAGTYLQIAPRAKELLEESLQLSPGKAELTDFYKAKAYYLLGKIYFYTEQTSEDHEKMKRYFEDAKNMYDNRWVRMDRSRYCKILFYLAMTYYHSSFTIDKISASNYLATVLEQQHLLQPDDLQQALFVRGMLLYQLHNVQHYLIPSQNNYLRESENLLRIALASSAGALNTEEIAQAEDALRVIEFIESEMQASPASSPNASPSSSF